MEGSLWQMDSCQTTWMFHPILLLRAWDLRAEVSNLVHRNEDYGDTQHKIDGETVAK